MNWLDYISLAFGALCVVQICWLAWRAGLLARGQDYTSADDKRDDARVDTIRDELDLQEGKTRRVRAGV